MKKTGEFIKKHKKGVIIAAVIAVIVIAIAVMVNRTKKKAEELLGGMTQETYVLEKRNLVQSVSGTGKISSIEKKNIVVAGLANTKVASINVELGDEVNEGDILCTFDTEDIERNLNNARQDLAISEKKTANSMDNQTRGLYNTQVDAVNDTNRNLEAVDQAQRIYDTKAGEKAEASRVFDEVYDVYEEYWDEDEYYDLQEEYQEVKKKLESYDTKTTSTAADAAEFNAAKEALNVYVEQTDTITLNGSSLTNLTAGDSILSDLDSATNTFVNRDSGGTTPDDVWINVKQKVSELQKANNNYISSVYATQNNLEEYNTLTERAKALSSRISNMETAKSRMESAKASVDSASTAMNSAGDTLENAKRTQEDKLRSDLNGVKDAENNYDSAKLDSSVASRTYEDNVRKYETQMEDATVRAPFKGIITAINATEGDAYNGQTLITIEDLSSYIIETSVDEYDINKVKKGQTVKFKTNATGDEELEAVVTDIAPRATVAAASSSNAAATTSSIANYAVKMLIKSDCSDLRLDMTAKLNIIIEEADEVYAVPFSALQTDDNGGNYIEVEDEGQTEGEPKTGDMTDEEAAIAAINAAAGNKPTKKIYVTSGVETDYYVEISSPELYDGMVVVIPGGGFDSMEDLMSSMGSMGGM